MTRPLSQVPSDQRTATGAPLRRPLSTGAVVAKVSPGESRLSGSSVDLSVVVFTVVAAVCLFGLWTVASTFETVASVGVGLSLDRPRRLKYVCMAVSSSKMVYGSYESSESFDPFQRTRYFLVVPFPLCDRFACRV